MTEAEPTTRKPRIAMMGEFSAGKSTLSNLLLDRKVLPEKVTATRLPPVWIAHGEDRPHRIDLDGARHEVALDELDAVPLDDTLYVRLEFDAALLQRCDLIDFPGISDPNMSSEVWERMLGEVDAVLWCTHATQAWRQSEAAVWEMIPETIRARSLLLITRFDKLTTDRDRMRVRSRVTHEAGDLFAGIFPISLTQAMAGRDDPDLWDKSGAAAFHEALERLLGGEGGASGAGVAPLPRRPVLAAKDGEARGSARPAALRPSAEVHDLSRPGGEAPADGAAAPRILPRRVRPQARQHTPRPERSQIPSLVRQFGGGAMAARAGGGDLDGLRSEFRREEDPASGA
ncbi:dynamin family protein [Albidovulum sp.]